MISYQFLLPAFLSPIPSKQKSDEPVTIELNLSSEQEVEAIVKENILLKKNGSSEASVESAEEEFQRQIAQDAFDKGIEYWTSNSMDQALISFLQSLDIREALYGTYHAETAKSYLWIGTTYWNLGRCVKSLDALCRSYRIRLFLSSGDPKQCAIVGNWINRVLEDALDQAIVKDRAHYWSMLENSISHERAGDRLAELGFYSKALEEYQSALNLENSRRNCLMNSKSQKKSSTLSSEGAVPDVADLHFRVADMYLATRSYEKAMLQYREALSVYLTKFGQTHPCTMKTFNRIKFVANKTGWSDRASNEYLGNLYDSIVHEKTGDMLNDRKGYDAALNEYKAAIGMEEACSVGMMQLPSATMYVKVADIYALHQKNVQAALPYYCRALGIFEFVLGSGHKTTIQTTKAIQNLLKGTAETAAFEIPVESSNAPSDAKSALPEPTAESILDIQEAMEEANREKELVICQSKEARQEESTEAKNRELEQLKEEEERKRLDKESLREEKLKIQLEQERREEEERKRRKKQEQEEGESLERKFWQLAYALDEKLEFDSKAVEKVHKRTLLDPPVGSNQAFEILF